MQYQYELPITKSGDIQIPVKIKERHFLEGHEPEKAIVQATGRQLSVTIWSPKDMIEIGLPFEEWYTERAYGRSLSADRITVERWCDRLDTYDDDGTETIRATVRVHDTDVPPKHPENES